MISTKYRLSPLVWNQRLHEPSPHSGRTSCKKGQLQHQRRSLSPLNYTIETRRGDSSSRTRKSDSPSEGSQWWLPHSYVISLSFMCSDDQEMFGAVFGAQHKGFCCYLQSRSLKKSWPTDLSPPAGQDCHMHIRAAEISNDSSVLQLLMSRMYLYWLYNSDYSRNIISGIIKHHKQLLQLWWRCYLFTYEMIILATSKQPSLLIMNILTKLWSLPTV